MKLLIVLPPLEMSQDLAKVFKKICEAKRVSCCDPDEALEALLLGEHTHILVILHYLPDRDLLGTLRILRESATADQHIACASWARPEHFGLDPKDFLRMPFTWEEVEALFSSRSVA